MGKSGTHKHRAGQATGGARARSGHRAEPQADRAHAKSGFAALVSVVGVLTLVIVAAGTLLAPSGATTAKVKWGPVKILHATKTVTATVTKTVFGPTATATVTKTVSGPTVTAEPSLGIGSPTGSPTGAPSASATTGNQPAGKHLPYVGAALGPTQDMGAIEARAGRVLGLHRTYWNYNNIASSIKSATADANSGRIPWLSYKLNVSWADAASGAADAATRSLAAQLATVPGPVWVAIHHEPEGDGNLSDWVAMEKRLLPILATAPNVRTSIILTAWDTFDSGNPAYSLNALWPGNMVSILGFDAYNRYGDDNHIGKGWTEMNHFYDEIAPAAKKLGVDWAIAETGYTDAAAAKDPGWLTRAYDDMANRTDLPGIGLAYFDSSQNSVGTWPLNGVKDQQFDAILSRSRPALTR